MGRKEKKKGSKTRDDDQEHKKEDRPKGRNASKKLHKGRNWKADKDDPIRKAVEAGKCNLCDFFNWSIRFLTRSHRFS